MNQVLRNISSLFNRGDRFLVLEISGDSVRTAFIDARFPEKTLRVWHGPIINGLDPKRLNKAFRAIRGFSRYKIILGFGPDRATTLYSSISLIRDNPKEIINEGDLDNLISQAIWKFFDRHRSRIATKMGVADLDVILTDARIRSIRLDGHRVVNPVGFKAKSVELQFSQTFLTRSTSDLLKQVLPLDQVVFAAESGSLWTNSISQWAVKPKFLLAHLSSSTTNVFFSDEARRGFEESFAWGGDNIISFLAAELGVAPNTARLIMACCEHGQTSEIFGRKIENLITKETQFLVNGLGALFNRTSARVAYIHHVMAMPQFVFANSFKNRFEKAISILPVRLDDLGKFYGFEVRCSKVDREVAFSPVAHLLEWHALSRNDKIEQIAKRRVRWLSPL